MATNYSTLLGLALPTQGELSGTWGDTVNNYITNYLDSAVAGAQSLTTDADATLTKTTNAALGSTSSQYAILLCTGARTAQRTITVPAASKTYLVINATTGGFGVLVRGATPTTGVVVPAGMRMLVGWNGSDFVLTDANAAATANVTAQSASATYQLAMTASTTTTTGATLSISSSTKPLTYNPSTGDFTAAGNVTAYSDESLKKDWADLAGDFVGQLAGVKSGAYTRIDGGERQVGVSAQSLQAVLPEAVVVGDDGLLSVAYGNAALAACVMLARKVAELESRLAKIEG